MDIERAETRNRWNGGAFVRHPQGPHAKIQSSCIENHPKSITKRLMAVTYQLTQD